MSMRDLAHNIKPVQVKAPAATTTTQTTKSVDCLGYNSVAIVMECGAYTDGTFTPTYFDSDDNSTFTATTAIEGSLPTISTNAKQNSVAGWVGYTGGKRYFAVTITAASTTTGMIYGLTAILGNPADGPTF